ncbi:MAG: sigma-70 family RNA polymerase sigma factor [Deltaproteobacteria bacterium]|nr:sigma-70 family RNA polymerase sigma factor [Deltaproteobacteria bacterium]
MSIPLDRQQRDALIVAHQGLVRRVARTMVRSVPRHVSVDDLVGFGQLGLIDAATRFDPSRGVQFNTFAYYRIRGAIFDQVRKEHGQDPIYRAKLGARAAVDDLLEERAAEGASSADALDAARALAGLLEETATALLLEETAHRAAAAGAAPRRRPRRCSRTRRGRSARRSWGCPRRSAASSRRSTWRGSPSSRRASSSG